MNGLEFTPYASLFRLFRNHPTWVFRPRGDFQHRQAIVLLHANIIAWNKTNGGYTLHPKQIKPTLPSAEISSPTPVLSDLGRVNVDWSGRGFSSGSYAVKKDKGDYLEIVFELDKERVVTVAKSKVKAA